MSSPWDHIPDGSGAPVAAQSNDPWGHIPDADALRPSLLQRAGKNITNVGYDTVANMAKLPFAVAPILPEGVKKGLSDIVEGAEYGQRENALPAAKGFAESATDIVSGLAPYLAADAVTGGVGGTLPIINNAVTGGTDRAVRAGESLPRAVASGVASGASDALMMHLPMATGAQRVASAFAMPAIGAADRATQNMLTTKPELHQDALDPKAMTTDLVMGMGFSGLAHLSARPADIPGVPPQHVSDIDMLKPQEPQAEALKPFNEPEVAPRNTGAVVDSEVPTFADQFPQGIEPGGPEAPHMVMPDGTLVSPDGTPLGHNVVDLIHHAATEQGMSPEDIQTNILSKLRHYATPDFQMVGDTVDHVTPEVLPGDAPRQIAHNPQVIDALASPVDNADLEHGSKYGQIFDQTPISRDALGEAMQNQVDPALAAQMAEGRRNTPAALVDAGGWKQTVGVEGGKKALTISGVQKQGGKRSSTSDLVDAFTPEPPGLFDAPIGKADGVMPAQKQLVPSLLKGGKQYDGKSGDTHADIFREKGLKLTEEGRGFATPDGKWMDRPDSSVWLYENQPEVWNRWNDMQKDELHSQDLAEAYKGTEGDPQPGKTEEKTQTKEVIPNAEKTDHAAETGTEGDAQGDAKRNAPKEVLDATPDRSVTGAAENAAPITEHEYSDAEIAAMDSVTVDHPVTAALKEATGNPQKAAAETFLSKWDKSRGQFSKKNAPELFKVTDPAFSGGDNVFALTGEGKTQKLTVFKPDGGKLESPGLLDRIRRAKEEGKTVSVQFSGEVNNASGESSASVEAMNRAKTEPLRYVYDMRTRKATPIHGVDAIDRVAGPHEMIVQNVGKNGKPIILDSGVRVTEAMQKSMRFSDEGKPITDLTREHVEKAFPGLKIEATDDGFVVKTPGGMDIKINKVGEVYYDAEAFEKAHGKPMEPGKRPVASFMAFGEERIISLTENGVGQLDHEAFHAAMNMALDKGQKAVLLGKFKTEEAAAKAYQDMRDGKVEKPDTLLQKVKDFVQKLRDLVLPNAESVMKEVASGRVWDDPATKNRLSDLSTRLRTNPTIHNASASMAEGWKGFLRFTAPMALSKDAKLTGEILREAMGRKELEKEAFYGKLDARLKEMAGEQKWSAKALDLIQSGSRTMADKIFNTREKEANYDFISKMQNGERQATPEEQAIADTIQGMFREKANVIYDLGTGALNYVRTNYFPGIWKKSDVEGMKQIMSTLSKRPLEGSKDFMKAKVFDDIHEGLQAGFTPISNNPLDLVALKMAEMDKYILANRAMNDLKGKGMVDVLKAGERMPEGMERVNEKYGTVFAPDGEKIYGNYVAPPEVAQIFNNYLSQNLYNNKYVGGAFTSYMGVANTLNRFQLGVFSAFHAGFTSMEAVISHSALGFKSLADGNYKDAGKYFAAAPKAWLDNPRLGDKIMDAIRQPSVNPEMAKYAEWAQLAGAKIGMDQRFQANDTQKMMESWANGDKLAAAARAPFAVVEQSARPILEWLVPRQKFGVFGEMADQWVKANPDATHDELRSSMQQIWNRVDSRLGQVVYDRLFIHNVAKNAVQALVRAPGWTGGTILEVGGGGVDLVKYLKDVATPGAKAALTDRAAYALSLVTVTALSNAVLTALFTGEQPQDVKDLIAFRTGGLDEFGRPERFVLPTYMKDLYSYYNDPVKTLTAKTHPLLSLLGDVKRNKDFYGTEIRHTDDNPVEQAGELAAYGMKAFIPFWIRGAQKEAERGELNPASAIAPMVGIMPAPADYGKSDAEKSADQFMANRLPQGARTSEEFDKSKLKRELRRGVTLNHGQETTELEEAVQSGKLSKREYHAILKGAKEQPLQRQVDALPLDQALSIYEKGSEKEREELKTQIAKKAHNFMQTASPEAVAQMKPRLTAILGD